MMDEAIRALTEATYNCLSKERANAAYMWRNTGESVYYESKWGKCVDDMQKLRKSAKAEGYKFVEEDTWKREGKIQYAVYKLVPLTQ